MADINVKVRKWGDSLAVIIPKEVAKQEKIRVQDKIHLRIDKEMDICEINNLFT